MTKFKRFVRKYWWLLVLIGGVVLYYAWKMFGPRMPDAPDPKPPEFLKEARKEIERVHLEGEVEKAKVRTTAEVKLAEIDAIEEKGKEDPAAANKDLAAWLAANL